MKTTLWTDLEAAEARVVKARHAIVRELQRYMKQPSAPNVPALARRARVAHGTVYTLLDGKWNTPVAQRTLKALGVPVGKLYVSPSTGRPRGSKTRILTKGK